MTASKTSHIMKFPIISTALVTLCALTATAQAEIKIASVNVQELYTKFYKRFDTETTLQKQLAEIKADIKTREDKLRALQEDLKKIQEQYDSSIGIRPDKIKNRGVHASSASATCIITAHSMRFLNSSQPYW